MSWIRNENGELYKYKTFILEYLFFGGMFMDNVLGLKIKMRRASCGFRQDQLKIDNF